MGVDTPIYALDIYTLDSIKYCGIIKKILRTNTGVGESMGGA